MRTKASKYQRRAPRSNSKAIGRRLATLIGLFGLVLLMPPEAAAVGFTQPDGGSYAKLWLRTLVGNGVYVGDSFRAMETGPVYQDHALNFYGELGVADGWTLLAHGLPVGYARIDGADGTYVGTLALGVRRRLAAPQIGERPLQIALEVQGGVAPALGDGDLLGGEHPRFEYRPTVASAHAEGQLQIARSTDSGWWSGGLGVRWFSAEQIDPALVGMAQVGFTNFERWVLDVHVNLRQPFGGVETTNISGAGQTRYLGFGGGASYWFSDHAGLHLGLEGVLWASSNAATPTLTVGIELR